MIFFFKSRAGENQQEEVIIQLKQAFKMEMSIFGSHKATVKYAITSGKLLRLSNFSV